MMNTGSTSKRFLHHEMGLEVSDSHAHYLPYSVLQSMSVHTESMQRRIRTRTDMTTIELPKADEDFAQRWVNELDRYDISCIGMMVPPEAWDEFADAIRRFPGRFLGYANINATLEAAEVEARRAIETLGFHGFKLYPVAHNFHAYSEAAYRIYQVAQDLGVPVLSHFGVSIGPGVDLRYGNPLDLQPAARDFPDVHFGIAHMGAGMFREALLLMYQTDNVYVDTSGSNVWRRYLPYPLDLRGIMSRALEAAGPSRIVFGTDSSMFPRGFRINILEEQLRVFQQLKVSTDDLEKIFSSNIRQLMGEK